MLLKHLRYSLEQYPTDDTLWQLIAYCAGTGGSILVIGSASGVALMGLEKVCGGKSACIRQTHAWCFWLEKLGYVGVGACIYDGYT